MTHDELLAKIDANGTYHDGNTGITTEVVTRPHRNDKALRAVVELASKPIDASGVSAAQVAWFYEGYNLAMDNVIDAIEKELK